MSTKAPLSLARSSRAPSAATIELGSPPDPAEAIELSIVLPALNEEGVIEQCMEWCLEGIAKANVRGEVVIVDSSTDSTPERALAKGARVVRTPKRGLGRAYVDATPFIRGKWVVMGDVDCTYDFRELAPFVEAFRSGHEFIMGSRFRGYIEPSAMPPHHRYFGTPLTTWILNVIFGSRFSDIHCGMRGITTDALERMRIESQSWEYASEMVLKSVQMRLRTTEVPVRFYKDRAGRVSHLRRGGWLAPWLAGWINLRAMFVYGSTFFLLKPGALLLTVGVVVMAALAGGPIAIGPFHLSLYSMLLGVCFAILGLQCIYMGALASLAADYDGTKRARWGRAFPYDRTVLVSFAVMATGAGLLGWFAHDWVVEGFTFKGGLLERTAFPAVLGVFFLIAGFMTFSFTLVFQRLLLVFAERDTHRPHRPPV